MLLFIVEYCQVEVCDSFFFDNIIVIGDMMNFSFSSLGKWWKMMRLFVKLKKVFVEIMMSELVGGSFNLCYFFGVYVMGMGMVLVDFVGYVVVLFIMVWSLY